MNTNTRYATLLNAARVGTKPAFVEVGYGQVEPNHLSAQRTGQIYGQLPADEAIAVLEQGQFVKYDYANEVCNFTGPGEWMLVFNEIKLYREGQNDCEFAMVKTDYNARIYSPYGEDKTEGRLLQSRFYNGVDSDNKTGYVFYKLTTDTAYDSNKTYYTKNDETGAYTQASITEFAENTDYYEVNKTYNYDKVTSGTEDIYEMFQTEDPYHIFPDYEAKKMPEGTKMVPRVFKTNVGDIFTTNTIAETTLAVGDELRPAKANGILKKIEGAAANTFEANDTMKWQVVKVYTMPDGQKGVKIMRIA